MPNPQVAALLLAAAIALVGGVTLRQHGPFAWALRRLGHGALSHSRYIAHLLFTVATGLVVFAALLGVLPQDVSALAFWATLAFVAVPQFVARLLALGSSRAP